MNFPSPAAIYAWKPACWLRASGPDAFSFLQGQFTNDLRSTSSSRSVYGLWLNLKGKVLADSFVLAAPGGYWIGSYASPATALRERLEAYLIADDVTLEDETERWTATTLFDVDPEMVAPEVSALGGVVFPGRRSRSPHVECVVPLGRAAEWRQQLGAVPELTRAEVERRRIEAGIPAVPQDIGPGDLPNEAGLEAEAISYTKGCYLGQEVMARLKSMGQVRRRLLRVAAPDLAPPNLPAPLFHGDRQVGELRSVAADARGCVGLAMVSLLHVKADTLLALQAGAEPKIRLVDQP